MEGAAFDGMLSSVEVSRDVMQTCLAHALTTEREEVMGLLLGDIEEDGQGAAVVEGAVEAQLQHRRQPLVARGPQLRRLRAPRSGGVWAGWFQDRAEEYRVLKGEAYIVYNRVYKGYREDRR